MTSLRCVKGPNGYQGVNHESTVDRKTVIVVPTWESTVVIASRLMNVTPNLIEIRTKIEKVYY